MADNTQLNSGSGGDILATDDIGGTKWPRSKITLGADGVNDGDVSSSNPLPVSNAVLTALDDAINASRVDVNIAAQDADVTIADGGNSLTVDNGGTFAVQESGGALTALQLLDNVVATDASASPSQGVMLTGHDGTNARRVSVDASGNVQVDIVAAALPSGAATEAKQDTIIGHIDGVEAALADAVTALQIIDDWDETNRAAVNVVVGQAGITAGAGAVGANSPRVTLASDDPAVALLGTIDTDTGSIATSAATLAGAVAGTEVQVDIVSAPTLTVNSHAVTNAGTFAVQVSSALPAGTNNIGDVDVATLPSELSGPGSPVVDSYASVAISASANTPNQSLISAPGANKQIWVYGYQGTADTGDGSISLQDEDDTALSGVMAVAEFGGFALNPSGNFAMPLFKVATNKALEIDTVTCGFKGTLQYAVVDVS